MLRVGVVALLVCVCSATAAFAATRHTAKQAAALSPVKPSSVHASLPSAAPPASNTLPVLHVQSDGAVQAAGTNTSFGAGQLASGELLTASTTFTMPSYSCFLNSDNEILAPGLYIYNSIGQLSGYMLAEQVCESGSSAAFFFVCSDTTCSSIGTPNPGDVMEAVYEQDSSSSALVLTDRTQGTQVSAGGTAPSVGGYAFAGDLGPGAFGFPAVPNFDKVPFSITTFDGFYFSDVAPVRFNLQTFSDVQIKSGAVKTTSFTTSWVHNY
jgi:hypothetical protein